MSFAYQEKIFYLVVYIPDYRGLPVQILKIGNQAYKFCLSAMAMSNLVNINWLFSWILLSNYKLQDYEPTLQDILLSRVATKSIQEYVIEIRKIPFHFYDVGGQRSQRQVLRSLLF